MYTSQFNQNGNQGSSKDTSKTSDFQAKAITAKHAEPLPSSVPLGWPKQTIFVQLPTKPNRWFGADAFFRAN